VLLDKDLRPTNLVWNASGTQLAFVADPDWRNELKYESPDLYSVTTTGQVMRLTDDGYVYTISNTHPTASTSLTREPSAPRW
jgi:Tol biopolymer transport system component